MRNVWIITTGNSDVQLKSKDIEDKEKGTWRENYQEIRRQFKKDYNFQPNPTEESDEFTVHARVLGMVYGHKINDEAFYNNLHFPLLDAFSKQLKGKHQPDKIVVILTNQDAVYNNPDKKCPYWKDTCTLKPIFEKYFEKKFPSVKDIEYLPIEPQSKDEGLDNWDKALILVKKALSTVKIDKIAKIYVSHQAGTPAISSAVQFVSLSKFGKQVRFLVSNEYDQQKTDIIPSSNYLQGIQLQEAKALLERYDYSGIQRLLAPYWEDTPNLQEQKLRHLLKTAIQWNCANFDDFAKLLDDNAKERLNTWWWTGYEAAYLAIVRLEQGNTVEALFHSFRAAEGLICKWAEYSYLKHIQYRSDSSPELKYSITQEFPDYIGRLPDGMQKKFKPGSKVGLYSEALYQLLQCAKPECQANKHVMNVIWNTAVKYRNPLFHRLLGLQEIQVFQAWETENKEGWKTKILSCLNFLSGEKFTSLPKTSLMYQVHQDLEKALIDYEVIIS